MFQRWGFLMGEIWLLLLLAALLGLFAGWLIWGRRAPEDAGEADRLRAALEEAQNATPAQIKLLLTRIGFNSKFFISGDLEQSDKFKDKTKSGLYDAKMRLQDVKGIGIFEFGMQDIVRNPIIGEILNRYD